MYQCKALFIWEAGRDVCRDGTLNGISPCMYISVIYPVPFIWKEFCLDVFRPVPSRQKGILGKAGQFLSYKHSVPLCRDDIMLSLQIVPGEIVPGRNILI